jgi:ATP-binding cassette subfamily F protein 3
MLQVNNLSKAYGSQILFDNAGFTVNKGERVGLVGRNGHGKTTLFRMILGEEHPDGGTISIPQGYSIGHLSQHISFSESSVLDEACLSLPRHEDGRDETYKAESILMGLGFSDEDFMRPPSELSGGYQIRLNLSKILIQEPNLLLLDEPTNYLDIVSIRWLAKFLREWRGEMMLITHDRAFMDSVTTHTMAIHRCNIRKTEGTTLKLYEQLIMEEEVYERTRINDEKKRAETELFIERFRAKATKARAVQSRIKSLQKNERLEKLATADNLDFSFNEAPFTGKRLIEADNISFSFDPTDQLIQGLSLSIGKRDRIAVIGKNGKGKTTLLNLLAGELEPQHGLITRHPALRSGYFGQTNIIRLNLENTVEDEILDVLPEYNRRLARTICGIMMFEGDLALKKISVLSGGERSRVLLGKIIASPANLLLLDEPTNHLDMESIDSLLEAIDAFDGAVVIVTHSEMILHAMAERLIVFDKGSVQVFEGSYHDFLEGVGWSGEESRPKTAMRSKTANKKDLRRMRAEVVSEKSKVLNPIQSRINTIEETIMRIEAEIENDNNLLLMASEKNDWQASAELSRSLKNKKQEIDDLFEELQTLADRLTAQSAKFEKRLSEIDI